VFLDENNKVKLGDFGLSKALAQASFAQTYVGVSTFVEQSLGTVLTSAFPDTLLHVTRAHAGEGVRFQVRHLVPWLPDIRIMRIKAAIPRGQDSLGAKYPGTQRSDTPVTSGIQPSTLEHHQGHAQSKRMSFRPAFWTMLNFVWSACDETIGSATPTARTN